MAEYDKNYIFMPLGEAKKYFNRGDAVDVLQVLVDDPQAVGRYGQALRQAGGPAIHVRDWRERNKSFLTVLEVERIAMFIILSLIILVAAFNIICGIMMLVKDKSRDIAVLRTMGATKGAVMRVFLITGASIGFVGTLAGLGIGLLVCRNIDGIKEFVAWMTNTKLFDPDVYYLSRLPAKVDVVETAMVVAFALLLSVLATLYPSWRASRLDPVEALRYE
ncbi:MAG: FtsX-like permease family protein, partial [Pseudomonadota bacterium]